MLGVISITNRCNLKCKMCDIGLSNFGSGSIYKNLKKETELTVDQWNWIFDRFNCNHIQIVGVEPLLYKDFDLLLETSKRNRRIDVTTNGWFIDKYINSLSKYCSLITVSIDGLRETHDKIRGVSGSFERAYEGVVKLKELNKNVRISFAITPDNINDIIPFYDICSKENIPIIFNHYNYIHSESCSNYSCSPSNLIYYNMNDIDINVLDIAIKHCKSAWLPYLENISELQIYYKQVPTNRKINKRGCKVLQDLVSGKRIIVGSDGSFLLGNRCWINKSIGNALNIKDNPRNNKILLEQIADIKKYGLPAPCQRLCCAGKVL